MTSEVENFVCGCCQLRHAGSPEFDQEEYARSFPGYSTEEAVPLCGDCHEYLVDQPYALQKEFGQLVNFVAESNRIEGIHRPPEMREIVATWKFLETPVSVASLAKLVNWLQPGAYLRLREGCNVTVGNHVPPPGGPGVERALRALLEANYSPCHRHWHYETLHPFTDGNGRSGRALWLHDRGGMGKAPLGFLHHFYYESLGNLRPASDYETR